MRRSHRTPALLVTAVLAVPALLVGSASAAPPPAKSEEGAQELLVIGHRGASGYRPEHTLAAYELAARMGADYIEPDVVSTKDGVLVARHENEISGTTDVETRGEFAGRYAEKKIDGTVVKGWFTEDFTLEELRTLNAEERLPAVREENTLYNGLYQVPTLDEVLALRAELSRELKRDLGVYIETKHPTYFDGISLSLEEPLLADLDEAKLDRPGSPVFIQSFETANLRELAADGVRVPLVQLLSASGAPYDFVASANGRTYADLTTREGLAEVAGYAAGVGPEKSQVIPRDAAGNLTTPTTLVDDAHDAGLLVHPYTFRNENQFLPTSMREGAAADDYGQALEEHRIFWATGIDGMFTDNPDTGVVSRELFLN